MAGVNDLIFSTIAPEALLRQYERLLDRIAAESPATQVFIQSPLPLDEARNEPYFTGKNARIEAFDRLLRRMAARRGLKFIDIRSRMLRDGKLPAEYTVDGIHLTPAGYARLGRGTAPLRHVGRGANRHGDLRGPEVWRGLW